MKTLIIGGTGNISSEVTALLSAHGHHVTIVTRGERPVPGTCSHVRVDRSDRRAFAQALSGYRGDVAIDFLAYDTEDCQWAHRVLKGSVSHYIFISSTIVYRRPGTLPLTEDSPLGDPNSQYGKNKIACERFLQGVGGAGFPVTIVRPGFTIGKTRIPSAICGSDYTLASRIESGKPVFLHDDGQSLWPITASSDFAVGLAGLLGNEAAFGETFHVTTDQVLTWNAIYREIGLAVGSEPQIVHIPTDYLCRVHPSAMDGLPGDLAEHCVFDNAKIRRFVPEFECRTSLRAAMRESVGWFNRDDTRKKISPEMDRLIDTCIAEWG